MHAPFQGNSHCRAIKLASHATDQITPNVQRGACGWLAKKRECARTAGRPVATNLLKILAAARAPANARRTEERSWSFYLFVSPRWTERPVFLTKQRSQAAFFNPRTYAHGVNPRWLNVLILPFNGMCFTFSPRPLDTAPLLISHSQGRPPGWLEPPLARVSSLL